MHLGTDFEITKNKHGYQKTLVQKNTVCEGDYTLRSSKTDKQVLRKSVRTTLTCWKVVVLASHC
jgi:hypothetical protein